jgi:predicted acetyltransferase
MRFTSEDPVFELRDAGPLDRLPLFRMLELYQHDLSDVWDQDLDLHGEYGYALDEYWSSVDSHAYVVLVDSRYAGFALVVPRPKVPGGEYWLEQYFIIKKYRKRGIGSAVATALFDSLPGIWQVGQMEKNIHAQRFWRRVIGTYTGGNFVETQITTDAGTSVVQQFTTRSARDA